MSSRTVGLKPDIEQLHLQQTLKAIESAVQGKVVDAGAVHGWLKSWGTENEQDAPRSGFTKL